MAMSAEHRSKFALVKICSPSPAIGNVSIWVKNSRVGQKTNKQTNKPHENHKENGLLQSIYVHNLNPTSQKTKNNKKGKQDKESLL